MDIKVALSAKHSRARVVLIRDYVGADVSRFDELMQCFFSEDQQIELHAAWAMSHCATKHPQLIVPYLKPMIALLGKTAHVAVKRNIVRVLHLVNIPEDLQGELVNICFDFLLNPEETIAVQAFSMTILYNITLEQPGLKDELRLVIEEMMPHGSAGIRSRGRNILKKLRRGN